MAKLPNVKDAELIACHVAADQFLTEMQDFVFRIEKGYVDKIETPMETARAYALIAKTASDLTHKILVRAELQKQREELESLRFRASNELRRNLESKA